ncbi:hypothetical protein [Cupriavidus necator]|uniref:hypothetical protein n=1 Tax=Cupriavidus necator TaxID=106590 RepID=UPI00339DA1FA
MIVSIGDQFRVLHDQRCGLRFQLSASLHLRHGRIARLVARRTLLVHFAQAAPLTGFSAFLRERHRPAGLLQLPPRQNRCRPDRI